MKSSFNLSGSILLICMLVACNANAAFITLDNGTKVYNTGMNLDAFGVDQSYRFTQERGTIVDLPMEVVSIFFLTENDDSSAFISPYSQTTNLLNGIYQATSFIDLTGIDLLSNIFSIGGFWLSDNAGLDILVNGQSTGATNSGSHGQEVQRPENAFEISSSSSELISGLNRIDFVWENGTPTFTQISPISLRVEFTESVLTSKDTPDTPTPHEVFAPPSLATSVFALFALAFRRRMYR